MSREGFGFAVIGTIIIVAITVIIATIIKFITGINTSVMNLSGYLIWGAFVYMIFYYFFGTIFFKGSDGIRIGMAVFVLVGGGLFFGIMGFGMYLEPSNTIVEKSAIEIVLLISFFSSAILGKKYPITEV